MSKPGFYRVKEQEPLTVRSSLSYPELKTLPPGTEIILHSHLGKNPWQERVKKARTNQGVLPVINGRRDGLLKISEIVESHTGHNDLTHHPTAINYLKTLGETGERPGHMGAEFGNIRRRKMPKPSPTWLHDKPLRPTRKP